MPGDRTSPRRAPRPGANLSVAPPADGEGRLSVIIEDGDASAPPRLVPKPPQRRPFSRLFVLGSPPRHSFEESPPSYTKWDEGDGGEEHTGRGTFRAMRENKHIAGRGGWKRLLVIVLVVVAIIIALAVGLAVGLRKRNDHSPFPAPAPVSSPQPGPNAPFPAGSYSLNTFLDSTSTSCTSNAATWRCYPYSIYNDSAAASMATFNWIIAGDANGLTISSTDNPFAINFVNASLTLVDQGTVNERYMFSIPINKVVRPSTPITTDNSMASCQYNNTQFQASLYTHMASMYPPNATASASASSSGPDASASSNGFTSWPYAVEVIQSIGGGVDVPSCYEVNNGNLGAPVTRGITPQPPSDFCSCTYKNYDP
ncbi:hypothetical protein MMC19_003192 [Ptychographa xylographoides]|nr:hypothetical protein [Ptychographa xylographoides]